MSTRTHAEQRPQESLPLQARLAASFVSDALARAAWTLAMDDARVSTGSVAELEEILGHIGPATCIYTLWLRDAEGQVVAATTSAAPPAELPTLSGAVLGGAAASPIRRTPAVPQQVEAVVSPPLGDGGRLSGALGVSLLPADGDDASDVLALVTLYNAPATGPRTAVPLIGDDSR